MERRMVPDIMIKGFSRISQAIYTYVSDWKNLLIHTITGVVMVLVIFIIPLPVYVRIIVFIAVILFNVLRAKLKDRVNGSSVP